MLARLTIYQSDRPGRRILLDGTRHYIIGRDAGCSIQIEDRGVSRRHARLAPDGDSWRLSDLCSKNGTLIGGKPVSACELRGDQWIEFGTVLACFHRVSPGSVEADRRLQSERWNTSIQMSRSLQPWLAAEELLQRVLESFVELAGAERGFIMSTADAGEFRADISHPSPDADFRGSHSVVIRAFTENRAVVCSNIRLDARLSRQASIAGGGISALVCVPLRVGTQRLGVIYGDSGRPGKEFTEEDVHILQAIADHAALVIGVARVRKTLVDLSGMLPSELDPAGPKQSLVDELQRRLPLLGPDSRDANASFSRAGEAV